MPVLDKPLSELKTYQGINPRPADFDAYWDAALKELDAVNPNVDLIPSKDIQPAAAEAFNLYFTGVGGARVHAKYLRPRKATKPHPAVLQFHGYSGHSGEWADKLNYVSEGFSVAALDCRGQAGLSEDNSQVKGNTLQGHFVRGLNDPDPKKLLFRQMFLDTAQLARIVMSFDEVDATRVGAMGGSQGGGLTLACAALEPRIKLVAPVFPFLSDYRRVWEMDLAKDAYDELKKFFRMYDPHHEREEEIFTKLGYIDVHHLAPRIKGEVLMLISQMDNICPPSTQFAAYNMIQAKKKYLLYPDFGHEGLPGGNDKIFNFLSKL